jgi:hypothetical protein
LGGIIAGIVMNFDKLVNAGGLVGKMFGFIKDTIDSVTGGLVDFLDYIGLTDSKASERAENQKKLDKENEDRRKKQEQEALKDAEHLHQEKERLAKEAAAKEAARIQKIKDEQKSLTDFLKGEQEKRYQATLSDYDRDFRQLRLQYDEKIKQAHGNKELLKQLDEWYVLEAQDIQNENSEQFALLESKGLKTKQATNDQILASTQTMLAGITASTQQSSETNTAINQSELAARLEMMQRVVGYMSNLADALTANGVLNAKQSFKVNKALQLTQAGIGAVQAVQNVLADPTLIGGSRFIAAAAVGLTGAANVAKIAAMKFNPGTTNPPPSTMGGGGGGSMFGGGGSTSAPAIDLSFLNNQQTKAQPIQSYVLATNVTSAQDAQQKILDQSKLIK